MDRKENERTELLKKTKLEENTKSNLLYEVNKRISHDSSTIGEIHTAVCAYREFTEALQTEAKTEVLRRHMCGV